MKLNKGFFVIGTDTDIGKTYVSTLLYKGIKELDGGYFKPVQSLSLIHISEPTRP